MGTLSDLIKISPGFKAAVNVIDDFINDQKVAAYLPTAFGREILDSVARGLDVVSTDRARIIHGNFGTGKSHLALLLAHFLAHPWGHPVLTPVLDKIQVRDPELYQRLKDARGSIPLPFLIVRLVGHRGTIAEGLLTALDQALQSAGLGFLMPETMFHAAMKRLEQVETEYSSHKAELERAVVAEGLVSVAVLKENLRKFRPEALEAFRKIHPVFSVGAPFPPHFEQKPYAVYKATAKKLIESKKYGGIFVLWDEFGENLRQLVTEHHRREYLDLQDFAEVACAGSRDLQIHFLGLTHQSLGELISTTASLSKDTLGDLNKMAGRFTQRAVRVQDGEIYRLMDEIIIPTNHERFAQYVKTQRNWLERWSEQASTLRLFPTLTSKEVLEVVGEGCHPLHPAAAFCLPELSEKVAQNERTLFYFLSAVGPGTLSEYLTTTPLPSAKDLPPAFTLDALWDYFAPLIQSDSRRIGAKNVWYQFEQTPKTADPLANRVLRVVALLQVVNHEKLRPTADTIIFCLGAVGSQKDQVLEILSRLSTGASRALSFSRNSGEYAFVVGSGLVDLEEELRQAVETRTGICVPATYVQKMKNTGLMTSIEPTDHNDKYAINRQFDVRLVTVQELEGSDLKEKGPAGAPGDALAMLVLAGDHAEVDRARVAAASFTNQRVLIAIPKEPVIYERLVRRLDALEHVRKEKGEIFGEGKDQSLDWQDTWDADINQLKRELDTKFSPSDEGPIWYCAGKEHSNVTGLARLRRVASTAMDDAFNKTLRISHDKLMDDSWDYDQQAKYRKAAVNYLFRPGSGPREAAQVESNAEQKVIKAVWRGPGYLRNDNGQWIVGRPLSEGVASEIWDVIEAYLKGAQEQDKDFYVLISQLRNPPYGMRNRVIPVLLAAVMHPHLTKLVVTRAGSRVTLDGDTLEKIVQAPRQYRHRYVEISDREEAILKAFEEAFGVAQADDVNARTIAVQGEVKKWVGHLSPFARETTALDSGVRNILKVVLVPLAKAHDPWLVITKDFPTAVGITHLASATTEQLADAARILKEARGAFDRVLQCLESQVLGVIARAFGRDGDTVPVAVGAVMSWYSGLSTEVRSYSFVEDSGKLIKWARSLTGASSREDTLDIAQRLIGEPLGDWTDMTAAKFEGKLESAVGNVSSFVAPKPPAEDRPASGNTATQERSSQYKGAGGDAKSESRESVDTKGPGTEEAGQQREAGTTGNVGGATDARSSGSRGEGRSDGDPKATGRAGGQQKDITPRKASVRLLIDNQPVEPLTSDMDDLAQELLKNLRHVLESKAQSIGTDRLAAVVLRLLEERMSS